MILLAAAVVTFVMPCKGPVDLDRMLRAISAIENPKQDPSAIGRHGEVGLYQFKAKTWKETTALSFDLAADPIASRQIAERRIRVIDSELRHAKIDATPYNFALCWRVGIAGAILHKFQPKEIRDYAIRVETIYYNEPTHEKDTP